MHHGELKEKHVLRTTSLRSLPPYLARMVHSLHTPLDPPNYYVRYRSGSALMPTHFSDPALVLWKSRSSLSLTSGPTEFSG